MISFCKKKEYQSSNEYIQPFLRRYRVVFWVDIFLSLSPVPLLYIFTDRDMHDALADIGYRMALLKTFIIYLSIAVVGISANILILRYSSFSIPVAWIKTLFVMGLRASLIFLAVIRMDHLTRECPDFFMQAIELWAPIILIYPLYHMFYLLIVHLDHFWRKKLTALNSTTQTDDGRPAA